MEFGRYLMNHVIGFTPFWGKLMLGDLGRHGNSNVYQAWSEKFGKIPCVANVTTTQAIIEKHNDSMKNVYLKRKNGRSDEVVDDLSLTKISQYELEKSWQGKSNTTGNTIEKQKTAVNSTKTQKSAVKIRGISMETFKKKKLLKGPGYYQRPRKRQGACATKSELPNAWT